MMDVMSINAAGSTRWHGNYSSQHFNDEDISISQPNLLGLDLVAVVDYHPYRDRFNIKYHEYTSVDDLNYYRKRHLFDCYADEHLKSHISLYNQSEPSLSQALGKTEYTESFLTYDYKFRLPLTRRHTTLQIESGTMDKKTEHNSKFIAYNEEAMARSRPGLVKHREAIKAFNHSTTSPRYSEYRSSFTPHKLNDFSGRTGEFTPKNDIRKNQKGKEWLPSDLTLHNKKKFEKTNIKLNGDIMLEPEYKNKYIEFPIEKSQSTPQLSNINYSANLLGMPSEYMECYKSYDNFIKSAPIKKVDNLCLSGKVDLVPEYRDCFRYPLQNEVERSSYLKREDNLSLNGDLNNRIPEYNSSYRNPAITQIPEKAKPKDGVLKLEGNMSYEPIYRCSFIDFPRCRPTISKPKSSIKLATQDFPDESGNQKINGQRKLRSRIPILNYFKPATDEELAQFVSLPEYRKAKKELLIKPKPLNSSKSFLAQTIIDGKNKIGLRQDGCNVSTRITGNSQNNYVSNLNNYCAENDHSTKVTKKSVSKNQKSSILAIQTENDKALHNMSLFRNDKLYFKDNKSSIIEANKHYAKNTGDQYRKNHLCRRKKIVYGEESTVPQSFVVLNAPIKQRSNRWFAPTTIYDSQMY